MLQDLHSNAGDFKTLKSDGTGFVVRMHNGQPKLPMDEPLQARPFVGMYVYGSQYILFYSTLHRLCGGILCYTISRWN